MPSRLDARAPGFAAAFAGPRRGAARGAGRRPRGRGRDPGRRRGRGRRGAAALHRALRPAHADARRACASRPRRSRPRRRAARPPQLEALSLAAERIRAFHARQVPEDVRYEDAAGVRPRPALAAGRCGRALRPGRHRRLSQLGADERHPGQGRGRARGSSMVAPTPDGEVNPLVLAAADLAGVDEIYRVGGAQAVAALAYGTASDRAGRQDRRARATPTSPRPSGRCSAGSAST